MLHAEALGEGGSRRAIEVTVSRTGDPSNVERGYLGQRGEGETNDRNLSDAIGNTTEMQMDLSTGGMVVQ